MHFAFGWRVQAHIDETTGEITAFIDYLKDRPASGTELLMVDFNFIPSNPDSSNLYHEMFVHIGLDLSWNDLGIDLSQCYMAAGNGTPLSVSNYSSGGQTG